MWHLQIQICGKSSSLVRGCASFRVDSLTHHWASVKHGLCNATAMRVVKSPINIATSIQNMNEAHDTSVQYSILHNKDRNAFYCISKTSSPLT